MLKYILQEIRQPFQFSQILSRAGVRMEKGKEKYSSIDEYINCFPKETQQKLEELRAAIKLIAPEAEEKISYQMPTFYLNGNLVHFAAYEKHIGFYPTPSGMDKFEQELNAYKRGKGSIQFPLDQPLPMELIKKMVAFRVTENGDKPSSKTKKH